MTKEEIVKKHSSLVTGGYKDMKPESRIKYHTQTTIDAIIEELEVWIEYYEGADIALKRRVEELKKQIEQ